jgi:ribose 5-phosphate isomerase B
MHRKALIGVDHGALELKRRIIAHLEQRGLEVRDMGVYSEDSVDYPDIARTTIEEYRRGGYDFGILCCGTGIGVSISANKFKGIRCALPQNSFAARMAMEHNRANFIAFGGRVDYPEAIEQIIDGYLDAEFAGDRHARRVRKISEIEEAER